MDWADIVPLINSGKWKQAREEIDRRKPVIALNDLAAIVEAAVCIYENDEESAYECIAAGLKCNCRNYELYVMLGDYYRSRNTSQAYLCYENAEFYCDLEEDRAYISQHKEEMLSQDGSTIPSPVSIVLVSYNGREMTKSCIQSIRTTIPQCAYELIVVDNASNDGITEWLEQQNDIVLIKNKQNKGFGYACNQGVKAAKPDNDIFFLNNDTLVPLNAIFWLRMGLYESRKVGATGSISNYVGNGQHLEKRFDSIQKYMEYGEQNNVPNKNPYERKVWLSGFALLIKRQALDDIGLFDLRYGKGFFEDMDIGIRLRHARYHLLLCRNSFIFHYGSQSFRKDIEHTMKLGDANRQMFQEKWGFDVERYTYPQTAVFGFIKEEKEVPIRVLEIGCKTGMTLSKIKYLWPDSVIRGIEPEKKAARLGQDYLGVECGNPETMPLCYKKNFFDYIIFSNVLETVYSPEKVIERFKPYLKENGRMLFCILNAAHISVLASLLRGMFLYADQTLQGREQIRYFAFNDIAQMMEQCGLLIEDYLGLREETPITDFPEKSIEALCQIAEENADFLQVFQYIVKAKKK